MFFSAIFRGGSLEILGEILSDFMSLTSLKTVDKLLIC